MGAFAFMRQNVGYVQSMSYIAAMFLLYSSGLFFWCSSPHSIFSYSDSPFDAFVAFSNVIIRPFFQNYFKRREVRFYHTFVASSISTSNSIAPILLLHVNRNTWSRGTMHLSEYLKAGPRAPHALTICFFIYLYCSQSA